MWTTATRRRRRRYNTEPATRILARGLTVFALLAAMMWLAATLYNGVPARDYRYVDALVPNAGSLILHDPVRIGGVRVGQVRAIDAAARGNTRLKLQLEPGTRVPASTQIRLRANGLLGQRYVELLPGSDSTTLPDGAAIRGDSETLTYGVTDALDVLDRKTRGALAPLIGELGDGLAGQGQNVNDLLRAGSTNIVPVKELFTTLRRPEAGVGRVLPSLLSGITPLEENRRNIGRLLAAGADALQPVVTERDATRAFLARAPGALAAADDGLTAARPLLRSTQRLARAARGVLPAAPRGLRATAALLIEARAPLRRSRTLLQDVQPTVPAVLRLTGAARPVLKPSTGLLNTVRSIASTIGPYGCDITNFGAVFRSMTGFGATTTPGGPNGPAMQFRLQIATPVPSETLSQVDTSGLVRREGYAPPCKYLAKPYPIIQRPQTLRSGR